MRKVSIVMTYFDRPQQLFLALRSIEPYVDEDVDIIVVDDASTRGDLFAKGITDQFKCRMNIQVLHIAPAEKTWTNPCIPYNKGFALARGEIVIIQNAETIHMGNCISYIRNNLSEKNYLSFSCYATSKFHHSLFASMRMCKKEKLEAKIYELVTPFNLGEWYNHPVYKPAGYHFLTAITRKNLEKIGGFNEVFADGYCFDDNEFLWRIRNSGIHVEIVDTQHGYVIHQWHEKNPNLRGGCALWEKNRLIWLDIIKANNEEIPRGRRQ